MDRITKKIPFLICLSLLILGTGTVGSAPSIKNRQIVACNGDRLTVRADDVPLWRILKSISRQTGIRIDLQVAAQEPIAIRFVNIDLETGLKDLTRYYNRALIYRPVGGRPGDLRLSEIIVFSPRARRSAESGREAATGTAAAGPEMTSGSRAAADDRPVSLGHRNPDIRINGLDMLTKGDEERAFEYAAEFLANDPSADVRAQAAETLGNLGDERAVNILNAALMDPGPAVRVSAVKALAEIGGKAAMEVLMTASLDPHMDVQQTASLELAKLGMETSR